MSYHNDSIDLQSGGSGSRLLSESPVLPSDSSYDNPSDDFSISELSLSTPSKPFSLLAKPPSPTTPTPVLTHHAQEREEEEDNVEGQDGEEGGQDGQVRRTNRTREEKLQSDLFVLKKINTAFTEFNDVLDDVGSANERIARQLEQTEDLLNKYVSILTKSEEFAKLIFDGQWEGGEMDETILERERLEALERRRREEQERALAAQREKERLEREVAERQERLERERIEREKKEQTAASRGGVRGVRGTRASMRGMRGATTAPGTARGSSANTSTSAIRGRPVSRIARGRS